MTTVPLRMPMLLKKFAARFESFLISVKVKIRSWSWSSHQTSAFFSGSLSAHASTMSKPKLKFSGTFTL